MVGGDKQSLRSIDLKTVWIIANWKSNKNIKEALEWIGEVGPKLPKGSPTTGSGLKIVVCPPFTDVEEVKKAIKVGNFPLMVGVQDLSPFEAGSYTGEEAASIMQEMIDLAILGHSERRQHFSETDQMVAQKAAEARKYHIIPLVCVTDLQTPVPAEVNLVAYEPVFAIGTGQPDTPENANKIAGSLKAEHGDSLEVLYGGSVTSANVTTFTAQPHLSGVLIGRASLDPQEFLKIIEQCLDRATPISSEIL